jgi:hypothetical protein
VRSVKEAARLRINKNDVVCGLAAADARELMRLFWTPKHARQLNEWIDDAASLAPALESTTFPSGHSTTPTQAGGNSSPSSTGSAGRERSRPNLEESHRRHQHHPQHASTFTDRWETVYTCPE